MQEINSQAFWLTQAARLSFEKQCSIMASCWTERGRKHSAHDKPINRICHSPINIKHSFLIFD